jgi:hypothetical protein
MARQWENIAGIPEDDMRLLIAIWSAQSAAERMAASLGRLGKIIATRHRTITSSEVRGMPCTADVVWDSTEEDSEPATATPEALPHDAKLSDQQIERADRGAE